ncbi:unnamed protein product [Closterium sp. NIES-65]|nr:unnamed protein product [Closterium sp. NIES-65]
MGGLKSGDTGATKWVVPQPQPVSGSTTPRLVAGGRRRRHTRQTGSGTTTRGPTPGFVLAARYLQWYMPRHQSRLWGLRVTFPSEANAHPGVQRKLRFAWRVRATPAYQQRPGVAPGARQGRDTVAACPPARPRRPGAAPGRAGGRGAAAARPPAEAGGRAGKGPRAQHGTGRGRSGRPHTAPGRTGGRNAGRHGVRWPPGGAGGRGAGARRPPARERPGAAPLRVCGLCAVVACLRKVGLVGAGRGRSVRSHTEAGGRAMESSRERPGAGRGCGGRPPAQAGGRLGEGQRAWCGAAGLRRVTRARRDGGALEQRSGGTAMEFVSFPLPLLGTLDEPAR